MLIYYLVISLVYILFIAWIYKGIQQLNEQKVNFQQPIVNVIVPARNEAANLAECLTHLKQQSYPAHRYEIIVVDDGSVDETGRIAKEQGVRCLTLDVIPKGWSPKKAALALAIRNSNAEIILTTDADCRAPREWIESMIRHFTADVGVVASWVGIAETGSLLARLEALDTLSYQMIGAAAIGHGKPFLANGANWGYRRELYAEVNGFSGIESLASGDDDLLLQKMAQNGKWRAAFSNESSTRLITKSCTSWSGFFMQRLRWASKSHRYPLSVILLEGFIFIYHSSLWLVLVLKINSPLWFLFLLVKLVSDALLVRTVMQNINFKFHCFDMLLAQIGQMIYTVILGLLAWRGRFVWKNRVYNRGTLVEEKRV